MNIRTRMHTCEARPVHSGMHMVDGVVAIIEGEKVHDRTHKVASSVVVLHLHTVICTHIFTFIVRYTPQPGKLPFWCLSAKTV